MKRLILSALLIAVLASAACQQTCARSLGGDIVIKLPPGTKLVNVTWKEDSIWYLTRPRRADEFPENHIFAESAAIGVLEGTVTLVEQ